MKVLFDVAKLNKSREVLRAASKEMNKSVNLLTLQVRKGK